MIGVLRYTPSREGTDVNVNGQSTSKFPQQRIGNDACCKIDYDVRYEVRTAGRNNIYRGTFISSWNPLQPTSADSLLPFPLSINCSPIGVSILGFDFLVLILASFFQVIRANFLGRWPKVWLLLFLIGLAIFATADCNSSPIVGSEMNRLEKRAAQVSLICYTYISGALAGTVSIKNIAYAKTVTIVYAVGSTWTSSQAISASYASGPTSNGYEIWSFSGSARGATQFYIRYDVSDSSYYDPGNNINYQITASSSTSTVVTVPVTCIKSSTSTSVVVSTTTTPVAVPSESVTPVQPPEILLPNPGRETPATPPTGCGNWNGLDNCASGDVYTFPSAAESRRWQTPPQGAADYVSTFQNYRDLIGYADIQYNSARTAAAVVVNAASRIGEALTYSFNGASQTSNTFQVTNAFTSGLDILVTSGSGKKLTLDTVYFVWQANIVTPPSGATFNNGQKGAIVELFGWPYADIAQECTFLAKAGYMGVKIWPPTESIWGSNYYENDHQFRPWYFVYQPVSYHLHSRMGTRAQLRSMIQTCRAVGVRVYADAVINHMVGQGNDIQNHRVTSCSLYSGHNATAGAPYYTSGNTYLLNLQTGHRPALEFPAVPYGPTDFHCERSLNNWTDGQTITKGWLLGLTDLNTEKPYVQDRIASYLVDLLSIGFSGFRVDAAKHIGPASMAVILGRLRTKMGGSMPTDWITWLEVIMGGEASLLACGGGEWSWYTNLDNQLAANGFSAADIAKVKVWSSDYPKEMPICGSWILPASRFAIQNDDHDQQNPGSSSRDMGDKGSVFIKDKDVAKHRGFEVQLFTRIDADWHIKLVLSSYMFMSNGAAGFPDGLSNCSLYTGSQPLSSCLGIPKDTAYVANACGYSTTEGKYTRVHRDVPIINAMRYWVGLGSTTASDLGISGCA